MKALYWKLRCIWLRYHIGYATELVAHKQADVERAQLDVLHYKTKLNLLIGEYRRCNSRYAMHASPETLIDEVGK
jgi:hypothetical protein